MGERSESMSGISQLRECRFGGGLFMRLGGVQDEVSTSIIKADRLGRAHYSADYKAQVLDAFETSSLSGAAFARQRRIASAKL